MPHPDLDGAEAAARRTLDARRRTLRKLRADRATPPEELATAFGQMADLYRAYDLTAAADACYENARALNEDEPRWAYAHGLLLAEDGRLEEAAAGFAQASRLDPGDGAAHLRRGEALLKLGRAEEARREFELGREAGEDFEMAGLFGIGRAWMALDRPKEAAERFEEVRRRAPEAGAVRYPLAQALLELGRREEAKALLAGSGSGAVTFPDPVADEIRELAVTAAALVARGGEALMAGRQQEAEQLYRKAVEADPSNVEARRNLALTLTREGRGAEALAVLEAARRRAPGNALVVFDLANARLAVGELDAAIADFQRAIEAAPDLEAAHFNLANALMQGQRWSQAQEHLRRTLELAPDNLEAAYLLAMARYQQGERREGLEGLRQVIARDPSMTAARMSLASILSQTGRLDPARRQYVAILEREDAPAAEKAAAYIQLASLSLRRRATAQAESQLRKALELAPGSAEASATLAQLLVRRGRPRQARTVLEQALERAPKDMELAHGLARLLATAEDPSARDGARALALAQEAYLAQRSLERAETIAMAMAERGDFAEAVRWQSGLQQQAQGLGKEELARRIAVNLKLYEAGKPVRIGG